MRTTLIILLILFCRSINEPIIAQKLEHSGTEAIEAFFDSLALKAVDGLGLPGLELVLANSNDIVFSKGWGYANRDDGLNADPQRTVWRLASISKVVTATAVMHLVEQGKADLDVDVNSYLKSMQIPESFKQPITLRHLLTHTAGFDDRSLGKSFRTRAEWPPLSEFIPAVLPKRIYPPGEVYSYSNIGNALAALVLEDISGQNFNEYCRKNLFLPLKMSSTSFVELDAEMERNLYHGYYKSGEIWKEAPFDYLGDYPAGQLLSTAHEFSRFMRMILNHGSLEGIKVLDSASVAQLTGIQFTHHPKLHNSVGLGFHTTYENGNRILAHDGGYIGLSTRMMIFPELDLALFIATNEMGNSVTHDFSYQFIQKFLPDKEDTATYPLEKLPDYDGDVERFSGYYRSTRHMHSDITKTFLLAGTQADMFIGMNSEGMLTMPDLWGNERRLIQVEPGLFQSIDDAYYMSFKTDEHGSPAFVFTSGTSAMEKIPSFFRINLQRSIILIVELVFLAFAAFSSIFLFISRNKTTGYASDPSRRRIWKGIMISSTGFALHWIAMALVIFVLTPWNELAIGLSYGIPKSMYLVQMLPILGIAGLAMMTYEFGGLWRLQRLSLAEKALFGDFVLLCLFYVYILDYWNLVGFKFG